MVAHVKSIVLLFAFLLGATLARGQSKGEHQGEEPVEIADPFFWAGPEGNLGIEITGSFNSEKQLIETLELSKQIGVFKSKKYPFDPKPWKLRDVLVMANFNGAGSVAVWRACGPKPLLLKYLERLRKGYESKSSFYTFSYKFIQFQLSRD